jgi:DNA polymerase-3 subunit beta
MKLSCTQENLSQALSYLERVVGKQTTLPILSNFLLETEKGRLKISATNLEIGVIVYIGAKIEKEGKIAVPAKFFSNFIYNVPTLDILQLEGDNKELKVRSDAYTTKIKGVDGKDFPIIPQYKEEYFFSLPAQEFKNALSRVLFCVSLNNTRLELTGAHMLFFADQIHIAATDSFRLAEEIIPCAQLGDGYSDFLKLNQSLIIPSVALYEIIKVITPQSQEVKLALQENQIFFKVDGVQITSHIINGKYPDYKQIIPKDFSLQAVFNKEAFQRAVRIAGAFSSRVSGEITLIFNPLKKQCAISSESYEAGENQSILPIDIIKGNSPLTIIFNPQYILEGVNVLAGDEILFLANDGAAPAAFRAKSAENPSLTDNYLYIMMPIRK